MTHDERIAEATTRVVAAIETYGKPVWCAKVTMTERALVPKQILRDALAAANISEGWSRQGDTIVFGRADSREVLRDWATRNLYAILTVREIADAAGVTASQVRTMIEERPDIFRKSDGRTYEVRDPNGDRKREKGN